MLKMFLFICLLHTKYTLNIFVLYINFLLRIKILNWNDRKFQILETNKNKTENHFKPKQKENSNNRNLVHYWLDLSLFLLSFSLSLCRYEKLF